MIRTCLLKTRTALLAAGLAAASLAAHAQEFASVSTPGESYVCAWSSISLLENPGRYNRSVGTVVFTEEVKSLGEKRFVQEENTVFVRVETRDGKTGWVNEQLLVKHGGPVVLLNQAPVYAKPQVNAAATGQQFAAGEIAILTDFRKDWVYLVGKKKEKSGWVQGYDNLSVEQGDLEIAAMMAKAMETQDAAARRTALERIGSMRGFLNSSMAQVVKDAIEETYAYAPQLSPGEEYLRYPSTPAAPQQPAGSLSDLQTPARPQPARPQPAAAVPAAPAAAARMQPAPYYRVSEQEVVDMATGKSFIRITETGTIQPVKAKNAKNIYYAYHKSLPIGSKVLLETPGKQGYIQLEVIARLRPDNPAMIGLGPEVIQKVFGEVSAKAVPSATILYPKP
jgi:hypothetical protein